jgi:hypothetical protein
VDRGTSKPPHVPTPTKPSTADPKKFEVTFYVYGWHSGIDVTTGKRIKEKSACQFFTVRITRGGPQGVVAYAGESNLRNGALEAPLEAGSYGYIVNCVGGEFRAIGRTGTFTVNEGSRNFVEVEL